MAKVNGTRMTLVFDGVALDCEIEATFTSDVDLPDASCKDDGGFATHIQGQRSWNVDGSARVDFSATFGVEDLIALQLARTPVAELNFLTDIVGGISINGEVSVSSLSITASNEQTADFDFSLVGNGAFAVTAVT